MPNSWLGSEFNSTQLSWTLGFANQPPGCSNLPPEILNLQPHQLLEFTTSTVQVYSLFLANILSKSTGHWQILHLVSPLLEYPWAILALCIMKQCFQNPSALILMQINAFSGDPYLISHRASPPYTPTSISMSMTSQNPHLQVWQPCQCTMIQN